MLARSLALIVLPFVALNIAALWLVESHGLATRPLEIQTRSAYQARLSTFFERPAQKRCVVLGDSLVFGGQLEATLGDGWAHHTLSARFAEAAEAAGKGRYSALNLGINGVLFSELRCVASEVLDRRPELLLVNVSPRPFSSDFRIPPSQTERAFLCPPGGRGLGRSSELAASWVGRVLPVLRYRDMIQHAWLSASPRERLLASVDAWLGRLGRKSKASDDEDEAELEEVMRQMAWRTKAALRYNAISVSQSHPQAAELTGLLRLLAGQRTTRVILFYLMENVTPLEGQLDLPHYHRETARFVALVKSQLAGSAVRFVVVSAEPLAEHFTDHIHLDPAGYELLAHTLARALP